MPEDSVYGPWPRSGEIDIMESRGNAAGYELGGRDTYASSLHWGMCRLFLFDVSSDEY
jgi:beta-glucanase (GH16 family)